MRSNQVETALLYRMPNPREIRMEALSTKVHQLKSLYLMRPTLVDTTKNDRDTKISSLMDEVEDILQEIEADLNN